MTLTLKQVAGYGLGLVLFLTLMSSFYTVEEGHVGIVKRFSEAQSQQDPGLHWKVPFIDNVQEMEIRTRKNVEEMSSSSKEQMPVKAKVSVNWTVDKIAALDLYKRYGGLSQFENRILDPRFRAAVKEVLPQYTAEQLIQDRASAVAGIESALLDMTEEFPISIDSLQIENIALPPVYLQSIQTKQTEKNLAAAEEHKLERQRLLALQGVNTADAKAQGILKVKAAEAKGIELVGLAEALAITAKAKALKGNALIVKLTEAQGWDGKLPSTIMGSSVMPIMDMRSANR